MCKVKSGENIKNRSDVQNLVIGIINRQMNSYTKEKIYDLVAYYFSGSTVDIDTKTLNRMIDDNLSFLYRRGFIDCKGGVYIPQGAGE